MEKENSISLVIIAKNEEKGLEKAISSCRGFVDEVIVSVDTASTDKTLEVAEKFADRVVEYEWEGSFAEARNYVQKFVKTKWALHLDGHEYVQNWDKLSEMLKEDVDALFIKIIMENGFTFFYPRIVRKDIGWQHKVHNTPKSKRNKKYTEFVIVHDRINYQTQEGKDIRKAQREKMLTENLSEPANKNKKDTRSNFYMGNMHIDNKEWKKAIKYYSRVATHGKKVGQKWLARFHLAICYNELGRPLFALWHLFMADKEQPNRWETAKMLGTTYAFIGWHEKALEHWVDSFKINTGEFMFCPIPRNDAQTWDFMSLSFAVLKRKDEMNVACRQALREERENGPGLLDPQKIKILNAILGQVETPINFNETIEVCFLVYQRPERVPLILEQLKSQTIQNFKVNIWNNSDKMLDVSSFPKDRIKVINSASNVGSQARFKLAKQTTGNIIIFFDDDQNLEPSFVEYNYRQYLKFGPKAILGWFTRTFDKEKYWESQSATYGREVDYIATKAMILNREIIDKEPLLQDIPEEFVKVEDLYLCYLARMKYKMKMIKIEPRTGENHDGKDQYKGIDKEKAFLSLRNKGWWLIKDGIKNIGGFYFKIRKGVWDEQILTGEVDPNGYQVPANPKVVVDIGAHIGGTAILCASRGAKVYAYEPEKENFNLLSENVKINGLEDKIKCIKKGVGLPANRTLFLKQGNSGMATLDKISEKSQMVEIIPIEEVFEDIPHCDFLKIDCEGAEYEFIFDTPFEKIDQISMELHTGKQKEVVDHLEKFYTVKTKRAIDGTSLMVFCYKKIPATSQLEDLLNFKNACDNLKIGFALAHGTLLGAVRDKDFIKGDENDIDVTIDEMYLSKMPQLFLELEKKGFKKTRFWGYKGKFRAGQVAKNDRHIDILIIHKKGNDAYILGPKRPISNKPYTAFVYPRHCFDGYESISFKGTEFKIPQKVEDFFVARYGKDWKIPKKWAGMDHLKPLLNPSLQVNYEI